MNYSNLPSPKQHATIGKRAFFISNLKDIFERVESKLKKSPKDYVFLNQLIHIKTLPGENPRKKAANIIASAMHALQNPFNLKKADNVIKDITSFSEDFDKRAYEFKELAKAKYTAEKWEIYNIEETLSPEIAANIIRRQYIEMAAKYDFFGYLPKKIIFKELNKPQELTAIVLKQLNLRIEKDLPALRPNLLAPLVSIIVEDLYKKFNGDTIMVSEEITHNLLGRIENYIKTMPSFNSTLYDLKKFKNLIYSVINAINKIINDKELVYSAPFGNRWIAHIPSSKPIFQKIEAILQEFNLRQVNITYLKQEKGQLIIETDLA